LNSTDSPIKAKHFLFVFGTVLLSICFAVVSFFVLGVVF